MTTRVGRVEVTSSACLTDWNVAYSNEKKVAGMRRRVARCWFPNYPSYNESSALCKNNSLLNRVFTVFAGAYLHDRFHVIDKNLPVAWIAGVSVFLDHVHNGFY